MLEDEDNEELHLLHGGAEPQTGGKAIGLTTREALGVLHEVIQGTLDEFTSAERERKGVPWLRDALHHESRHTPLCWTSAAALVLDGTALIVAHFASDGSRPTDNWLAQGLVILALVSLNLWLVLRESRLRHLEMSRRIGLVLQHLKGAAGSCRWAPDNYPHLYSPHAPCITLQWTYRDGRVVNLPWALLVAGDVIVVRPGQAAPGRCAPLEDGDGPELRAGETYVPPAQGARELSSVPAARAPYRSKLYVLRETPCAGSLGRALRQATDRPVTYFSRARHLLMARCVEQLALPAVLVFVLLVNLVRFVHLCEPTGCGPWPEMFLVQPAAACLPLLPLVFPAAWTLLGLLGMARVHALARAPLMCAQDEIDPFEEADLAEPKNAVVTVDWSEVWENMAKLWRGRGENLSRSVNLLQVLGSITALCCVDKKGVLSWPNPTAEKVFFLRNPSPDDSSSSTESQGGQCTDHTHSGGTAQEDDLNESLTRFSCLPTDLCAGRAAAEVLDLTHDRAGPFRLQFDDRAWRRHLSSLKPLGLAALLNTCNMRTHRHYSQFCAHVSCEAAHHEDLVPVTNRRCLCELAKQIGFVDQAQEIFDLEVQLSTFRHVHPEMMRRDMKFARTLSNTKLKFPFPHMVGVLVRERVRGDLQLMTQGTADIVLDSCVEFWDGRDLCPLSASDRKKILDFYQRSSLTAYCTAFSYRPLTRGVSDRLSEVYLELPPDSKHLYAPHRSPTPLAWDLRGMLDARYRGAAGQFHSTDSLLGGDAREEDVGDVDGCFELQCNQVFIGMVTMQYQAQIDMVQLIDQLERACIRFVHFSKENELRSRVFSEKMGLESGWNCHISLLSERGKSDGGRADAHSPSPQSSGHRTDGCLEQVVCSRNLGHSRVLSFSAPSAINLEFSQVKFEEEAARRSGRESLSSKSETSRGERESQDSVLMRSVDLSSQPETWRSLSCLTDSTEQEAPVNFDMSNRANLPRGIENIRPHLERVDNVPLLVSLFTDCDPAVTCEMLRVMQDYGEVVCVLGSSASADNTGIFLQADASLAVEPLYPQVCQKVPAFRAPPPGLGPSPVDLSRMLNSVACSLSFCREDPISIFHLVMESRHHMQSTWNCVQFWTCCAMSLSCAQALAACFMMPPLLSAGSVLWLACVVVPALSTSLVGVPTDPRVMQQATGKNQCVVNTEVGVYVLWCYGLRFLPGVVSTLVFHALGLRAAEAGGAAHWGVHPQALRLVQEATLAVLALHFVTVSVSFVRHECCLWRGSPHVNKAWVVCAVLVCALQAGYTWSVLAAERHGAAGTGAAARLPVAAVAFGAVSPLLTLVVAELVKREEIKANVRYQKRARLEFGTKLGMNSPF
ncbi:transmembrane protein 94 isoform X2 [Bacillus rossius redtenbacheri]|uniref:transmembrane protein 94 isoform X2 n=1 Tax=Bacillus rossius redtenbacheri TaxID=93214 RepID=UPI002FDEABDE